MFEYAAQLLKVIDGDTVDLRIDLGFNIFKNDRFRLLGLDAPERYTDAGKAASEHLLTMLDPVRDILVVRTHKVDKYGRYLAEIVIPGGATVNDLMLADGFAVAWDGKGQRPGTA